MADKKSFLMYKSWAPLIMAMQDDQAGMLFKAVYEYQLTGEEPPKECSFYPMFSLFKATFDDDKAAYEKTCETNRRITEERERKKMERNTSSRSVTERNHSIPDNDNDKDNDKDIDNDSDNDSEEIFSSTSDPVKSEDLQKIADRWNELPETVARLKSINRSGERWRLLRARIKENGVDGVLDAIDKVRQSSFLVGKNDRGWTVTFDWFIKPGNFSKVSEGNYKDRIPTARSGTTNVFDAWDRA